MSGLLDDFPVTVTIPVAWGEMDFFRHVNNTVFFRYFESARIEYLGQIGFQETLAESGIGPILASTHARFRRPLTYPDTVQVGARTTEIQPDRFIMQYRLVSGRDGSTAADGGGVLVAYNYAVGKKAVLPEPVRQAIIRLENWGGQVV